MRQAVCRVQLAIFPVRGRVWRMREAIWRARNAALWARLVVGGMVEMILRAARGVRVVSPPPFACEGNPFIPRVELRRRLRGALSFDKVKLRRLLKKSRQRLFRLSHAHAHALPPLMSKSKSKTKSKMPGRRALFQRAVRRLLKKARISLSCNVPGNRA
jgi:hypothetical protein